ncbi:unnamed protein product, partial [Rotaria socialis]
MVTVAGTLQNTQVTIRGCPVDDAGCHVRIPSNALLDDLAFDDECDSMQRHHLPTMTDMLIAFPSQKARHAEDTDLCSMLNMVNGCVSREVKNKGKKQTAEYKSSFTKKGFYFYPDQLQHMIVPYHITQMSNKGVHAFIIG